MNNTYVFLCQFDKERHVRIGEIFISPILKPFRHNSWIISSCLLDCTPHLMYEMWLQLSVHLHGIFRSQFLGPWGLRPEYSGRSVTRVKTFNPFLSIFPYNIIGQGKRGGTKLKQLVYIYHETMDNLQLAVELPP